MEKEKRLQLLKELLAKLTDAYYDADELDDDCASAISVAEDTVIKTISLWEGK
tara:strand:+ start:298 stop:456 length:159 start_codon:yes stop_codon:yes gene_type:complete